MKKSLAFLAAGAVGVLILLGILNRFFVDLLWFGSLGLRSVFTTVWLTEIAIFVVAAALSFAVLLVNGLLALKISSAGPRISRGFRVLGRNAQGLPELLELSMDRLPWKLLVIAIAGALGLIVGSAQIGNWETVLKWLYGASFHRTDPIFGYDLSFYLFTLPAYDVLRDWGLLILVLSAILAAAIYWLRGEITHRPGTMPNLSLAAIRHLSALLAIYFVIKAASYLLDRYELLTSNNGVVFGATYTDVHLRLPLLMILAAAALLAALLCAVSVWRGLLRLPIIAVALLFALSFLQGIVPGVFQSYWVKPDELRLESRYIANNIAATRFGFGLENISSAPFPAKGNLTRQVIAANEVTIQNIRWWDPRPLLDTYRQLQEIRLYYDFSDIDIDRYMIEGAYREVMLSARELNQAKIPAEAQTWINQRFKFTHGNGIAMNPVNRFDEGGLPVFYVKDIPPVTLPELKISRPEIYFGEKTTNYVVVGGDTKEFDYAKGQENVYNTYAGHDGVSLGSFWRRALFAWHYGDIK
ncbi:MAG TPA: UPF0182 family protein, partial [Candidatus Binatia bacterium]